MTNDLNTGTATMPPIGDFRAVIWDLEGTLWRSDFVNLAALNSVLAALAPRAQPLEHHEIQPHLHKGAADQLLATIGMRCAIEDVQGTVSFFRQELAKQHPEPARDLMPHIADTLSYLQQMKILQAVSTNRPQHLADHFLKGLGIDGCFLAVVGIHDGIPPKPDPTSTRMALSALSAASGTPLSADSTLYIGDDEKDALACRALGIRFGLISHRRHRPYAGEPPAIVFPTARDVRNYFNNPAQPDA